MKSFLKRMLGVQALPERLSYEEGRAILEAHKGRLEHELAGRPDAKPEMLYYLAARGSAGTRKRVAGNPSTPAKANRLLADDSDDDVRAELARKIGRLLPNLLTDEREAVCQLTLDTLQRLAQDQMTHVRAILADEIKSLDCVPRRIVNILARDIETTVAVPVLEYSPLLWDDDLVEIVASARARGALAAVARRRGVSETVCEAIVSTLDNAAIATLLSNADAKIREETMEKLVDFAEHHVMLHAPLALRCDLSLRVLRRIAGFVGAALLERLAERHDLDEETVTYLNRCIRTRLDKGDLHPEEMLDKTVASVRAAAKAGKLDETFVESVVQAGHRDAVIEALAHLSGAPHPVIEKIFASRSGKAATALAWRAGLTMRVAFKIQNQIVKLKGGELVPARAGVAYPMTDEEMRWHLSYFGLDAAASSKS